MSRGHSDDPLWGHPVLKELLIIKKSKLPTSPPRGSKFRRLLDRPPPPSTSRDHVYHPTMIHCGAICCSRFPHAHNPNYQFSITWTIRSKFFSARNYGRGQYVTNRSSCGVPLLLAVAGHEIGLYFLTASWSAFVQSLSSLSVICRGCLFLSFARSP